MANNIPPLPPGFTLDNPDKTETPPLPPGYVLDEPARVGSGTLSYIDSLKSQRLLKDIESLDQETKKPAPGITEMITGEERSTPLSKESPEFRPGSLDEGMLTKAKVGLGVLASRSPEETMQVIKESIPDAEFMQDEKGNVFVSIDGKLSVLNKPGISTTDSMKLMSDFLAFLPAGKLATLGKGFLAKFGIGALASGATEAGIQETGKAAGIKTPRELERIGIAAGLGGIGETVGPAVSKLKNIAYKKSLKKAGEGITDVPETIAAGKEAIEGVKSYTGVDVPLYKPQQTLLPSDLTLQRLLPQLDASSQYAKKQLTAQNEKVSEAVDMAVENLIPGEVINAPEELRTAAGRAIEGKKLIRKELSSPLFNEAKNEVVDVSNVVKLIDDEMKPFLGKSNIKTQLQKIKGNVTKEKTKEVTKEDILFHDQDVGTTYTDADISEYNLAVQRSQEIARDKIKDTYLKQDKEAYKEALSQATKDVSESGTYKEMNEAISQGGLDLNVARQIVDDVTLNELMRRRPGIFKKSGYLKPDEFANDNGFDTADEMFQEWMKAGTKKDAINKMADDLYNEYGMYSDIERGLENQEMFIDLEAKAFTSLMSKKPPKNKAKIKNIIETVVSKKESGPTTIKELQKAKAVIDDILNVKVGDSALKGDSRRIVTKIKEELLTAMDGAGAATPEEAVLQRSKVKNLMDRVQKGEIVSPEEIAELPAYGQGRVKFAQASPGVAALEKGMVGKLAKANNLQIEQIANTIFDPKQRPETIRKTKKILDGVDPDIFPQIMKYKMLDNLSNIKATAPKGVENIAAKTRTALFGNPRNKAALLAGMSPEQKKNFLYIDAMLERASVGRMPGSPTTPFKEALKNITSVPMMFQKIFTANVSEIKNIGSQGLLDKRLKAVAKMIYDDSWASELSTIRTNTNKAMAAKSLLQLINNINTEQE